MAGWEGEGGVSPCHYGTNESMKDICTALKSVV